MEEKLQQLSISKAIMIGIALAGVYFFAIYDSGSRLETQISTKQAETTKAQQELTAIKKAIADAERFQKTKETLGQELDLVLKAIPVELTPLEFMRIVSNEAKVVGASILSLTQGRENRTAAPVGKDQEKPFFEPVSVNIGLEGTYNQLMMFLSNLTKVDKIVTVSNLKLQLKTDTADSTAPSLLKLEGELKAYRYLPQEDGDKNKDKKGSRG